MTAFVKTITVGVNIFGPEPTEKWSATSTTALAMVWGQDYWGYGTVGLPIVFYKGIFNSVSSDSTIAFRYYVFPQNSIITTSAIGKDISHYYANSQDSTSTVGKIFEKYNLSTFVVTTAIGRDIYKAIYNDQSVASTVDLGTTYSRQFTVTAPVTTEETVKKLREGYTVTYGDQEEVGLYPRPTSFTMALGPTSAWTRQSTSATTWS